MNWPLSNIREFFVSVSTPRLPNINSPESILLSVVGIAFALACSTSLSVFSSTKRVEEELEDYSFRY